MNKKWHIHSKLYHLWKKIIINNIIGRRWLSKGILKTVSLSSAIRSRRSDADDVISASLWEGWKNVHLSSNLMNCSQSIIYCPMYIPKRQTHYIFMSCFATLVQTLSREQTFGPLVTHRWAARLIYGLRNAFTYIMVSRSFDVAIMTRKMYITLWLVIVLQNREKITVHTY